MESEDLNEDHFEYLQTVYNTFARSRAGKELIKSWERFYIYRTSILDGRPEESAKRDGEKRFVLKVLCDIEKFKKLNRKNNERRSSSSGSS